MKEVPVNSTEKVVMQGGRRILLDVLCVVAAGALVYRVLSAGVWSDGEGSRRLEYTRIGEPVALSQVSWRSADRHLVLVLTTTCPACQESAGFYRRLAAATESAADARFVVLSQQPKMVVEAWLESNGIRVDEIVRETELLQLGLSITPSLLLVDRAGRVAGAMVGQLTFAEEQQVLDYLAGRGGERRLDNIAHVDVISCSEEGEFSERVRPVVVDIRERVMVDVVGLDGRVNIPLAEFRVRAPIELSRFDAILLDCSVVRVAECRSANRVLRENGFTKVTLLGD